MTDADYKAELKRLESEITEHDAHISDLQGLLKDAKKQREEKVSQLRGTIRDMDRPLLQMGDSAAQEDAGAHDEPPPRGKGRRRTNGPLSGTEAVL